MVPRPLLRLRDRLGEAAVEDVVHERALARAGDARDRDEHAERHAHVDVLQVVLARALHHELLALRAAAVRGHGDAALAREELAGERARLGEDVPEGTLRDDVAAVLARARADVDDPVRAADGLLVVLDDDDGIADVAHAEERADEPRVVALVEADRRLVEDVEDAHEARADLRREPDALRLAAGERRRRTVHRQVLETDVHEEAETRADLLEDLTRDLLVA